MQVKATPLAIHLRNIFYGLPVFAFYQSTYTGAIGLWRVTEDTESRLFSSQQRILTLLHEPIYIIVNMLFHIVIF